MRDFPPRPRVLLGDPALGPESSLVRALASNGCSVEVEFDGARVRERLSGEDWDVVLFDPNGAAELLDSALAHPIPPAVILLDGFGSIDDAVRAMRRGAFDYIAKPAPDEQVVVSVRRALEQRSLLEENKQLRANLEQRYELANLVSRDPRMQRIFETIRSVADTRANVLIEGESGTGKTMLARAIHLNSSRAPGPFVVVDCGALPGTLLESELFGHVRGAFTGAVRDRAGKFELGDGGTVFLDEIATASLDLQVKLLRVIESRRFERVGDAQTREVDVRIVAAGNRPLAQEVAAGRFREDLFYRLNVVSVEVPPLRERPTDISLLADAFLARLTLEHDRPVEGFAPEARQSMLRYPWPGNVRELENRVERGVLLAAGARLVPADLGLAPERIDRGAGAPASSAGELGPLKKALEEPERRIIVRALEANGGNRKATAEMLDINRTTLFNKMRKYDLLGFSAGSAGGVAMNGVGDA